MAGCRDLGAHIDGFSAVVAHTLVVGANKVCSVFILSHVSMVNCCQVHCCHRLSVHLSVYHTLLLC